MIIEGHFKLLVNAIKDKSKINWSFASLLNDTQCLLLGFEEFFISHIFREANEVADALASFGHHTTSLKCWQNMLRTLIITYNLWCGFMKRFEFNVCIKGFILAVTGYPSTWRCIVDDEVSLHAHIVMSIYSFVGHVITNWYNNNFYYHLCTKSRHFDFYVYELKVFVMCEAILICRKLGFYK